jgi:hypothetical protein
MVGTGLEVGTSRAARLSCTALGFYKFPSVPSVYLRLVDESLGAAPKAASKMSASGLEEPLAIARQNESVVPRRHFRPRVRLLQRNPARWKVRP